MADENDFPWAVAIGSKVGKNNDFVVFCAGSLITDRVSCSILKENGIVK